MTRISMREFKPLTLQQKSDRLRDNILDLKNEKMPLTTRNKELEIEMAEVRLKMKENQYTPDFDFVPLKQKLVDLRSEKKSNELKILQINNEISVKSREDDVYHNQLKRLPEDIAKEHLTELRDKYLSFSADTTRVSSMRSMAAKFVEEIQGILKIISQQ